MSRRRWIVLLGPPLILAMAAVPALSDRLAVPVGATSLLPPVPISACATAAGGREPRPGAWWRSAPVLDASGVLAGWSLQVGAPGRRTSARDLPAASTISGPHGGLVLVAVEGPDPLDSASSVLVIDTARGCAGEIPVRIGIARRAVPDPRGAGVLVHLLASDTRRDLGVWRLDPSGEPAERVLEPLPDALREQAGMDRVWTTDLRQDTAGRSLAVQSCHPAGCVTRLADLDGRNVVVVAGPGQGPMIGLSDGDLVTWGACPGLPCPVLIWDRGDGRARTVFPGAIGASVAADERTLVVVHVAADGTNELLAVDLRSGRQRSLGPADDDVLPLPGGPGAAAGLEVPSTEIGIGHAGRTPTSLRLTDVPSPTNPPEQVVQP
ncbi:MAG: hypothetical protein HW391_198 [Chloroflexi bacterium]|nr:hypothetical protein [Chloroflexota bacterium]